MPGVHSVFGSAVELFSNNTVPATTSSSVGHGNNPTQHFERLFIGPMLFSAAEGHPDLKSPRGSTRHWLLGRHDVTGRDDDMNGDAPERHAFQYFLRRGGTEEVWESQDGLRQRVKQEMLSQWRQSGWEALQHRDEGKTRRRTWVGTTFKVGDDFLGLPMHADFKAPGTISSRQLLHPIQSTSQRSENLTISAQTYHTALQEPSETRSSSQSSSSGHTNRGSKSTGSEAALIQPTEPSSSRNPAILPSLLTSTSLPVRAPVSTQMLNANVSPTHGRRELPDTSQSTTPLPHIPIPLRSALHHSQQDGASKSVQFSTIPQSQFEPVSPSEVLARRPSSAPDTSAGAAVTRFPYRGTDDQGEVSPHGDIIRRARMLVRRSHVKSGIISKYFDEKEAMRIRDFCSYEWKEFLVVWRKQQLELYEDYSLPGKETLLGHKHLACVIPLYKPDTHLSLYSFIDLTFCLTCTMIHMPKDKTRSAGLSTRMLFNSSMGTDVFVFKAKTRTSAIDWMWELWIQLGNDLPQSFEVHCPALQTHVKLNIPGYDLPRDKAYKVFTRDHIIDICQKALGGSPSWDYLIEEPMRRGARLELCWRRGSMLDWIRWETDVNGMKRDWAVLYGLCLGKPREVTHLEVRIGEHRPTTVTLEDGSHLNEPPAIEGYVYRIKPNSQSRTQVYISTHGGCLFSNQPSRAHPPRPPIPMTDDVMQVGIDAEEDNKPASFKDREIQRGAQQVLQADAFVDLRSIVVVRRACQLIVQPLDPSREGENSIPPSVNAARYADAEDDGGEEALVQHPDKPVLRMRRSFELLMKTGHVVRFETYSCKVAQEWVEYLSQLIKYWTHRHRVDASNEMELIRTITGTPNVTSPECHAVNERLPDYDEASQYLPTFWNWCVVDGCLSVVRNGRLFLRRSFRGQYRLMQLILVSGHLVQFHITSHRASHHMRSQAISLLDAYVCSGHFATQSLPVDEFAPGREPLRRRFQDGLESEDGESDTIFLLWYRPHPVGDVIGNASKVAVPSLKAKHRVLVLKARSKLERDAWCWALNTEIERLSRRTSRETVTQGV